MIPIDLIVSLTGLVFPAIMDFFKKKFIKAENDTPERTMGTLATTKPEFLADYVKALSGWVQAQKEYFNRDVVGTPSIWVVNLRACIRPFLVAFCAIMLIGDAFCGLTMTEGARLTCEAVVTSWVGDRLKLK